MRLCQVAQLMDELQRFAVDFRVDPLEATIVGGDWNSESLEEIRAVAQATCRLEAAPVHPLLFSSVDVPTRRTSSTLLRRNRIDYIMHSEAALRLVAVPDAPRAAGCIPDEQHPSDHVPIAAEFEFRSREGRRRHIADRFVRGALRGDFSKPLQAPGIAAAFEAIGAPTPREAADRAAGLLGDGEREAFEALFERGRELTAEDFAEAYGRRYLLEAPFRESMACAFAFFDVDGDGAIQPGELRDTLKRIRPGISDATVDDILERADSDHNGEISPDEFGAALLRAYSASLRRCNRS